MALRKIFNSRGRDPSPAIGRPRGEGVERDHLSGAPGSIAAPADADGNTISGDGAGSHTNRMRGSIIREYEALGIGWIWASDASGNLIYLSDGAAASAGCKMSELLGSPLTKIIDTDPENPDDTTGRALNFRLNARHQLNDLTVRVVCAKHRQPEPYESDQAVSDAAHGSANTGGYAGDDAGANANQAAISTSMASPSDAEPAELWWSIRGKPAYDEEGEFIGYRGSASDVTNAFRAKLEEVRLAEYDSLTGLANRYRIEHRLEAVLSAYRQAKRACALMMLDLDRFKNVNDTLGHQAGDDILRQVSERLRSVVGQGAEIGRLGGDEFQIIIPDMDDRGKLGDLADKIIQMVSQPYSLGEKRAVIGTSIGIAIAPYDGLDREELTHAADLALYAAKHGGRCAFRFYSVDLQGEAAQRDELESDLRGALKNGELEVYYQPVVRTCDNMVDGCEALLRWHHPERGPVSPEVFIPVAEDSDLIVQIGEWVLRQACQDALKWPRSMRVSVNISPVQFCHPAFPALVTNVLAATGLAPDRLELELTEAVFMGDSELVEHSFAAFKKYGVRLALDDFGAGYSSLSYLRSASFDKLKVDQSFVDGCTGDDPNSGKMIAAIIGLSKALDMEATVEGVEARDQFELVCALGAELVQGWIYAQAMPQQALLERLESGAMQFEPDGPERHRQERRTVFRRIGIIHGDHHYRAVMRDLSSAGARVEGLEGVPLGENLVLDLGDGQLCVCTVTDAQGSKIRLEFETALVSNGAGGLCTRHRVSPYALAAAGMPLTALPPGSYPLELTHGEPLTAPRFSEVAVRQDG